MSNKIQKTTLTCLLAVLPLLSHADQTCKTDSISATTPDSQFIINNNATVKDAKTGLVWKRCSEGETFNATTSTCDDTAFTLTWQQALQQVQTVNTSEFAGANDWRVPNIKELRSIVEKQCVRPSINLTLFPNTPPNALFWSSSAYAKTSNSANANVWDNAWTVYFDDGNGNWVNKNYNNQVRLVRSGQ